MHEADAPSAVSGSRARRPLLALALLLVCVTAARAWAEARPTAGMDYYQFWVIGQAVQRGETADIYSDGERERLGRMYFERALRDAGDSEEAQRASRRLQAAAQRQTLQTYSTPWLYALFGVCSSGDYERDLSRFQLVSLLALVAGILALARLLGYALAESLLAAGVLLAAFWPVQSDASVGNVNRLQLALLAGFLWLQRSPRTALQIAAGALLGLTVAMKPNLACVPLLLLVWYALARQTRRLAVHAGGLALGGLLALLGSAAFFGSLSPWFTWLGELPRLFAGSEHTVDWGNYAIPQLAREALGWNVGLPWTLLVIGAAVLVVVRHARRMPGSGTTGAARAEYPVLAIGCVATLLASGLTWLHYYLLALPLCLWLLRPLDPARADRGPAVYALTIGGMLILAFWPLHVLLQPDPTATAALYGVGTLLLFGLGLRELMRDAPVTA